MKKELIIKKCMSCGATVEVLQDCNCEGCKIKCCGEEMKVLVPNTVDAAAEKHIPTYELEGEKIKVTVNHVMEDEHFIEWIACVSDKAVCKKFLNPGEKAEVTFKYCPNSTLYAYCNKHGLWQQDI